MKLIGAAVGIAFICAAGAAAQSQTTGIEGKKKVEVKDGKDITVAGCLERETGGGYILTSGASGPVKYELVTDDDLSKHVGHRVEVKGKATDKGDAKVKVESKVGTSGSGDEAKGKAKSTTTMEGDLNLHYLGVHSVKKLSSSCR
jgi:hypothetical protein